MEDEIVQEEKPDCVICGKVLGIFGIVLGALFLYISIDVLTGSKLTSRLSGNEEVNDDE